MSMFLDPELYRKHKDEVLRLSDSFQVDINEHLTGPNRRRPLSDAEIAERLGLDEALVREIRVVAERDYYPLSEWDDAIHFKREACRAFSEQGVSYATRKYLMNRSGDGAGRGAGRGAPNPQPPSGSRPGNERTP